MNCNRCSDCGLVSVAAMLQENNNSDKSMLAAFIAVTADCQTFMQCLWLLSLRAFSCTPCAEVELSAETVRQRTTQGGAFTVATIDSLSTFMHNLHAGCILYGSMSVASGIDCGVVESGDRHRLLPTAVPSVCMLCLGPLASCTALAKYQPHAGSLGTLGSPTCSLFARQLQHHLIIVDLEDNQEKFLAPVRY